MEKKGKAVRFVKVVKFRGSAREKNYNLGYAAGRAELQMREKRGGMKAKSGFYRFRHFS